MRVSIVGPDIAKHVFQLPRADQQGRVVLRRRLRREQVTPFFANLPACLLGLKVCGGAHHWARRLRTRGHTLRLIAPQFVKPYVKSNKTTRMMLRYLRGREPTAHAFRALTGHRARASGTPVNDELGGSARPAPQWSQRGIHLTHRLRRPAGYDTAITTTPGPVRLGSNPLILGAHQSAVG
jgi:hypothetical protein